MKVSRGTIVDLLNERGERHKVAQAERELPVEVDTDADAVALSALGLDELAIAGFLGDPTFGDVDER